MTDSIAFRGFAYKNRYPVPLQSRPSTFLELFGVALTNLWDSYASATGILTDSISAFNVNDGGTNPPAEAVKNTHHYPVFNGVNNGLESSSNYSTLDGLSNWTMFTALKTNAGGAFGAILDKALTFFFELSFGAGSIAFSIQGGGAANISGTIPIDDDQWHRVVVTCNSGVVSLYIDGVLDGTDTGGTIPTVSNNLLVGVSPTNTVTDSGLLVIGVATIGLTVTQAGYLDDILTDYIG